MIGHTLCESGAFASHTMSQWQPQPSSALTCSWNTEVPAVHCSRYSKSNSPSLRYSLHSSLGGAALSVLTCLWDLEISVLLCSRCIQTKLAESTFCLHSAPHHLLKTPLHM